MAELIDTTPEAIAQEDALALRRSALDQEQVDHLAANGQYLGRDAAQSRVVGVEIHEYKGGPVGQGPGYMTRQIIDRGGVEHVKVTDHGRSGRTEDWQLLDDP